MENNQLQMLKIRENFYRFLSRLYLTEVDEELLNQMKVMTFPKCTDEDMAEGYELWRDELNNGSGDILDDLAVDYAKVFLSAGIAQGMAAFPYESVYTSKKHLMMQDARNDVMALYAARGLKPGKDLFHVPEDHIGLEFEYMACLCAESAESAESLEEDKFDKVMKEQKAFVEQHLHNWVPVFCSELIKYANTSFYKGLGKITRGFMAMEFALLTENV